MSRRESSCSVGLSPLARGTQEAKKITQGYNRFIPAGAGNTIRPDTAAAGIPVYPRWRGEHNAASRADMETPGLSPLARGTL